MSTFGYILRYYLPVKPYFDEAYTEKRFEELLSFCKDTHTEAVMLYVALSPDWYYMPDTVEYCREVRDQLFPYIQQLRESGISYQLNFQNLVGSTLGGMDFSDVYGWENAVDQTGRESLGCGCILGDKFRAHAGERLRLWAETNPDVIWIDDDLRLHNHGTPVLAAIEGQGSYSDYYCFCDEHIRRFNEQHSTSYDRETLVAEILREGEPSPVRQQYLDFQATTIAETADWIRRTVQEVSPNTRLAQMTSNPDVHAAEGRDWNGFLSSLCGEYVPITRPHFGPYQEELPPNFVQAFRMLSHLRANIRQQYDGPVVYSPEVENTRFTVWAKSAAATAFQLSLAAFMGCNDITLSIYDLEGGAFVDEPAYRTMLIENKAFLSALVDRDFSSMCECGVAVPCSPNSGRTCQLENGQGYETLGGGTRSFDLYLLKMGIPCRYANDDELMNAEVVLLDRYSASYLSDDQLEQLLCGKALIDGGAATVLIKRGFGAYLGVTDLCKKRYNVNAEIIHAFTRDDGTYIRVPSRVPFDCWFAGEYHPSTEILSEFLTPRGERYPAMTLYENEHGGTIAMYYAEKNLGDGFFTHHRVTLFKQVIARMSSSLPRIDCHNYLLSSVREKENGDRYYFVANLSTDTLSEVTLDGETVHCPLGVYGCAVFERKNGKLTRITIKGDNTHD